MSIVTVKCLLFDFVLALFISHTMQYCTRVVFLLGGIELGTAVASWPFEVFMGDYTFDKCYSTIINVTVQIGHCFYKEEIPIYK